MLDSLTPALPSFFVWLSNYLPKRKKKKKRSTDCINLSRWMLGNRGIGWGVGRRGSLIGRQQALPLGVFQDGVVAEEVLVWGLDAEGPLAPHAAHRLPHVERADVLQLGQADVQGTERTWRSTAGARPSQRHTMIHLVGVNTI